LLVCGIKFTGDKYNLQRTSWSEATVFNVEIPTFILTVLPDDTSAWPQHVGEVFVALYYYYYYYMIKIKNDINLCHDSVFC
jgi:hypothetical protein